MAIMIKEYIDHKDANAFYEEAPNPQPANEIDLQEAAKTEEAPIDPDSLMVEIEGIHAYPHATRNYTRYMPECLANSVPTWTKPYHRPLIKHHNEKDGDIIGRVIAAEYISRSNRSKTPALKFTANVSDEDAKKAVKDGRLDTVSISGMATDVRCSICGRQLADGDMCEHERGMQYKVGNKTKTCYWDIYQMEAKELSYVIVPSDIYAKNECFYPAFKNSKAEIKESLSDNLHKKGEKAMPEPKTSTELEQAQLKISELTEKVSKLEESAEAFQKQSKEFAEKEAELEKQISDLTEAKEAANKQITDLTNAKKALEDNAANEKALKESLETQLADTKAQLKESLIDTLQAVRLSTGRKAIDSEVVSSRTEDSIRDSISDLKEDFESRFVNKQIAVAESSADIPAAESVEDPTAKSDNPEKGKKLNVAESAEKVEEAEESSVDLEKAMSSLFSDVLGARRA